MRIRAQFLLLAITALTLQSRPADATVVLESSLEDMTRLSALVVHAEVVSVSSHKVGRTEGPARIATDVTLRVVEALKGTPPDGPAVETGSDAPEGGATFTLTLPGGQAGEYVMMIPGMPKFRPGQEVVLFLEKTRDGYIPSGLQQGRFSVMREPVTGERIAVRTYDDGLAIARREASGRLDIQHVEDRVDLLYLDDFKARVRAVVARFGPLPEVPQNGVLPPAPATVGPGAGPGTVAPTAP